MKVQDAVVIITGGGQGLGRAMAEDLAGRGARLALIDLNPHRLDETVESCRRTGTEARPYICNVADEKAVESTFEAIRQDFGRIDALINNAGIIRDGLMVKAKHGEVSKRMTLQEWQSVIDVNLTGVFLCGREAATHMIQAQRGGCIINISSLSRAGNVGQSNYSAAKAGVVALASGWARELARYQIRTGAIAPGFIETEMTGSMKPEALERMTAGIPLKRAGQPDHIAQAVAFILENDYFSGRVIEVDGGLRL